MKNKIPVRGRKHVLKMDIGIVLAIVEKQNPRKGTETLCDSPAYFSPLVIVEKQNPRKGTETFYMPIDKLLIVFMLKNKIPVRGRKRDL